jgi:hypothetical protein
MKHLAFATSLMGPAEALPLFHGAAGVRGAESCYLARDTAA